MQALFAASWQAVEACYSLCHGGGCSAAELCLYNALNLITRERWLAFPPTARAGIAIAAPLAVSPGSCGLQCAVALSGHPLPASAEGPAATEKAAVRLFNLPAGLGGRHPDGLPAHAVDGHTRRGSGMDTTDAFLPAARRWGLAGEVASWPAAEVSRSHGPGREYAPSESDVTAEMPFTKGGFFRAQVFSEQP